eukprot:GHVS01032781.1.p1 GENE.GHVS01032781.1~~GHVS01032781.1.p1  ORF type:complete len:327 (-),score=96.82 GHVS01032781.1:59-1039(-)
MEGEEVLLGYLEQVEKNKVNLDGRTFPSKVGGCPAWLQPQPPPSISCCRRPMSFLLQIYAPKEEDGRCFHRSLFVFVCRRCSAMRAWRGQLPRRNPYYSYYPWRGGRGEGGDEPAAAGEEEEEGQERKKKEEDRSYVLRSTCCAICGMPKTSCCCASGSFTEYLLDIELEPTEEEHRNIQDYSAEETLHRQYNQRVVADPDSVPDASEEDAMECLSKQMRQGRLGDETGNNSAEEDPVFDAFVERTGRSPSQVVRYCYGGRPLWFASSHRCHTVPACSHCGAQRVFEFQIQPTLIHHIRSSSSGSSGSISSLVVVVVVVVVVSQAW